MSAFVLADKQFDMLYTCVENRRYLPDYRYVFGDMLPTDCLIEEWRDMNIAAVCQRYPGDKPEDYPLHRNITFCKAGHSFSDVKFCALLDCLIYQCHEGNVPESDTYKKLEALRNGLMRHIIGRLPDYNWKWEE